MSRGREREGRTGPPFPAFRLLCRGGRGEGGGGGGCFRVMEIVWVMRGGVYSNALEIIHLCRGAEDATAKTSNQTINHETTHPSQFGVEGYWMFLFLKKRRVSFVCDGGQIN